MRPVAVVDIDTTLANNDHRANLLSRVCSTCAKPMEGVRGGDWPVCSCGSVKYHTTQESWDQFLSQDLMLKDSPQPHALDVLEAMRSKTWWIVFMTGRNEKHRGVTEAWLKEHMRLRQPSELVIMRPKDAIGTPASETKEKMFLEFRDKHNIPNAPFLFFEDDRFVLGMWQKYGLVFLCPQAWEHMNPVVHDRELEPAWNR